MWLSLVLAVLVVMAGVTHTTQKCKVRIGFHCHSIQEQCILYSDKATVYSVALESVIYTTV